MRNGKRICFAVCLLSGMAFAADLAPFGATAKAPARTLKPVKVVPVEVDFLNANRSRWNVELPLDGHPAPFSFSGEGADAELRLDAAGLKPAYTTVRMLLPGDGPANGNVWARNQCNYIAFECRSEKSPAPMSCHLLQRGKTAGTYKAAFDAQPGEWQCIVLPVGAFGLRNFANIAGLGFRTREGAAVPVAIRRIRIGGTPYTDATFAPYTLSIDLKGTWRFQGDHADKGLAAGWQSPDYDDSAWCTLSAGQSWQAQGVDLYGWGWYRQRLRVPEGCEGLSLALNLGTTEADDDVWFNGVRIGGIHGAYKYKDRQARVYAVPAKLVRPGADNVVAVRLWGGNVAFQGASASGLAKGTFSAVFDPLAPLFRLPDGESVLYRRFDLSDAQRGLPFEMLFRFPESVREGGAVRLQYRIADLRGNGIASGETVLAPGGDGLLQAVASIDEAASRALYLRGRCRASLTLVDAAGAPLYLGTRDLDGLSFAKRDATALPALAETFEETPYGRLRLVDEIDCSRPHTQDAHPYLESGVDHDAMHMSPGIPGDIHAGRFQGRDYRECGYNSWFAYRIGRGGLKPHATYLLRVEYPEDKTRFATMEIQTGQNYMDVGWRNGTAPDGVYDPWPLSGEWRWYDVVFPLDDETVGADGTESASARNGVWVYFTNKQNGIYYSLWDAGPAVARLKLYEIDPVANAPRIAYPEGLPRRTLQLDWERQADHDPADFVAYARLMGYNAISPIILKWAHANYGEPLEGYSTTVVDPQNYWSHTPGAASPWPERPSQHRRYLDATRGSGIDYLPRVEWGGSLSLPESARSIEKDGTVAKPNRFSQWGANLLDEASWEDWQRLLDAEIKPFAADNPQLKGLLWRIRCDRARISYGEADLLKFFEETGTPRPAGRYAQWAAWASGAGREAYDAWWHAKRAAFHARTAELLRGYRPDLRLQFFPWDSDKFGIIQLCTTAWGFNKTLTGATTERARELYRAEEASRRALTAADYIATLRTGDFGDATYGINRADYGIRPDLYRDIPGVEIFAPANYLCYADQPAYFEYFRTHEGVAMSNPVAYDEIASRSLNPKYEGNMLTPGGAPYSMAMELLAWFHGDARTITYTVYTYGRGFADAHRRFAQAFLALPAVDGRVLDSGDPDIRLRLYETEKGTYLGVAHKGLKAKKATLRLPASVGATMTDLVTGKPVATKREGDRLVFTLDLHPMELDAFRIR